MHGRLQIRIEQLPFDAPDLGHARQKDEQTALVPCQRAADDFRDGGIEMPCQGFVQIDGLDRKHPAFAGDDRRVAQQFADRSAIQRGRHDKQVQVGAEQPLRFEAERQAGVGLEAALVKLVEEHGAIRIEGWILLEQPGQNSFGDDFKAGPGSDLHVEPHAVADGLPDILVKQFGHAPGCGTRGEPGLLAACYRNSLALARQHGLQSIAFPAISCGVYGYPLAAATRIAVAECRRWLAGEPALHITFALFGDELLRLYRAELDAAD